MNAPFTQQSPLPVGQIFVEQGLRIAVRRSDLKKLTKRLEEFGYLSPDFGLIE